MGMKRGLGFGRLLVYEVLRTASIHTVLPILRRAHVDKASRSPYLAVDRSHLKFVIRIAVTPPLRLPRPRRLPHYLETLLPRYQSP